MTMAIPAGADLADVLSRIAQIQALLCSRDPAVPAEPDPLASLGAGASLADTPVDGGVAGGATAGAGVPVASFPQALANAATGAKNAASALTTGMVGAGALASSISGPGGVSGTAFVPPLPGATITQPFGPTSFALEPAATVNGVHYAHYHDGVDLAAPLGTLVHAAASGRVVEAGRAPDGAVVVAIRHDDGSTTRYAHLEPDLPVQVGEEVRAGDVIGAVGMTGETTGPHLHFELWRSGTTIDPMPWLQAGHLPGAPSGSATNGGSDQAPIADSGALSTSAADVSSTAAATAPGAAPSAGAATTAAGTSAASAEPDNGAVSAAAFAMFGQAASAIPYGTRIEAAAAQTGLDPFLLAALVKTESGFNASARSAAGAEGLTQLMPATSQELGVREPFDPQQNLLGGARYLRGDLQQFGSVDLALAAYLDGRGAVEAAGGVPADAGTRAYIDRVVGAWNGLLEERA